MSPGLIVTVKYSTPSIIIPGFQGTIKPACSQCVRSFKNTTEIYVTSRLLYITTLLASDNVDSP